MIRKKKEYPSVQLGSSLMLVILIVLCLTVFATLSLVSALRDYKYSTKSAEKTYNYYQADAEANRVLADISEVLQQTYSKHPKTYTAQRVTELEKLDSLGSVTTDEKGKTSVQYQVSVNEQQLLSVTLVLKDKITSESGYYTITEWKEIAASEWQTDTTLPLLGSD